MYESLFASIAFGSAAVSTAAALFAALRPSRAPEIRSLRSKCDSLSADYAELLEILKRLDARDRMRRVRAAKTESESSSSPTPPDPYTNPAEWKKFMRHHRPPNGAPQPTRSTSE